PTLFPYTTLFRSAALEADLVKAAGARLLALVAAAGGLAPARADAAADAVAVVLRARRRLEFVQFHRSGLDSHQIGDEVDHAAHRRRIDYLDHMIDSPQP